MQQKRFGSQLWSKVESENRKGQGVLSEHGKHDGRRKETVGGTGLLKLKALLLFFCMGQNGLNVSATPTGWGGAARHPYVSAVPNSTLPVDQHASKALRARTHSCDTQISCHQR